MALSLFNQIWTAKRVKLDDLMAEPLLIINVLRGEFIGFTVDPAKPPFVALGIVIIEDLLSMTQAVMSGASERTDVILPAPEITFRPIQFNNSNRPAPVAGTRIVRTEWPGSPSYELETDPLIDSQGQLVCRLAPVLSGLNYPFAVSSGQFGTVGSLVTLVKGP